ncbi:unnamed protein product [Cyprideis torosa]|uniref:Uncharacterized protein n=1 Tax=Cyprideis torosa TaxID=163714 RepID=A0A7R8ZLV6_9CRUS|nr:unnamed protein product [Cyprideis torosa]CAG0892741.1 unnamed protein product [Cyprideis torosa]
MKTRFSTLDLSAVTKDLRRKLKGLRAQQIYDIDNRTYLIRLQEKELKYVLLLESGVRIHTTSYEWPKQPAPSNFSMKLRKHIGNKRLENIEQLGVDRVLDLTFGTAEAAYHLIVELYDRGNILLTDYEYVIMNVLRPRKEGEDVKIVVREVFQRDRARQSSALISFERMKELLAEAKPGVQVKKLLVPHLEFGGALVEHCLVNAGYAANVSVGKGFEVESESHLGRLYEALEKGDALYQDMMKSEDTKGYIILKPTEAVNVENGNEIEGKEEVNHYVEFHPFLFEQIKDKPYVEFDNFDSAVDEFFSQIESQRLDQRALMQQKDALKKLTNVREDQERRINALREAQEVDFRRGELVDANTDLVEKALTVLRSAVGAQMSWEAIEATVREAQAAGDPVASAIKSLNLPKNSFTMFLEDPYDDEEGREGLTVEISLDLSAHANARKYFEQRRFAAKKEQKTVESSTKALKSAEKKTKQTLKEAAAVATINKARKVFWFEKFFWFISSENYLVIAGRDQQQNEIVVKRFLRPGDVYVHADLHGASSVVVKNKGQDKGIPPKTLNEAGIFAVAHSSAWDAKVMTTAWWVEASQVSKKAPTGEYLTTGSFMIRGKKNYLPQCDLIMGFGFLFKLDEGSVGRHLGERRERTISEGSVEQQSEEDEVEGDDPVIEEDQEIVEKVLEEQSEDGDAADDAAEDDGEESDDTLKGEDYEAVEFPDTAISVEHQEGGEFVLRSQSVSTSASVSASGEDEEVYFLGDANPVRMVSGPRSAATQVKRMERAVEGAEGELEEEPSTAPASGGGASKRGRRGKLKKIKGKYKDQDEEEREMRMKLLASAGQAREKKKKGSPLVDSTRKKAGPSQPRPQLVPAHEEEEEVTAEEEAERVSQDEAALNSLTGIPVTEDEILFAVPLVAPYACMGSYKFRVKLTPGTTTRGKAAKTALNLFVSDKGTSPREKDLLRSVKDQDLARNIPGKVKLSAPHLQRTKRKK